MRSPRANDLLNEKMRTGSIKAPRKRLRVAGLFAGIGGFELGLHRAGHTASLLCELDRRALAVLRTHFPKASFHDDIRTLKNLRDIDLVAAGFPCQDLSQAGRMLGMNGTHSIMVSHVFRLLKRASVPWVVLENVPFMLQLGKGHALEYVVGQLERLGYWWAYRVVDARCFGIPQRRERVFLVAALDADPRSVLFCGNEQPVDEILPADQMAYGFYWTEGTQGLGWARNAVPTLKAGSNIGIPSPPAVWLPNGSFVLPEIRDAERLQGFPPDWTLPAQSTASRGIRWKLIGNAVNVEVASWLGERLLLLDGVSDDPGKPIANAKSWPNCAWNCGNGRRTTVLSTWPVMQRNKPLATFFAYPPKMLSSRATSGFLSRFRVSSLAKPTGMIIALTEHLKRMNDGGYEQTASKEARIARA
jgi:DNA (cytosine-5)-methyltransferase 1